MENKISKPTISNWNKIFQISFFCWVITFLATTFLSVYPPSYIISQPVTNMSQQSKPTSSGFWSFFSKHKKPDEIVNTDSLEKSYSKEVKKIKEDLAENDNSVKDKATIKYQAKIIKDQALLIRALKYSKPSSEVTIMQSNEADYMAPPCIPDTITKEVRITPKKRKLFGKQRYDTAILFY